MTPDQIKRKNEIFTAEKIIDISKAISNEKRQASVIVDLQDKIDSLQAIVRRSHSLTMAFSNKVEEMRFELESLTLEKDLISDKIHKSEKKKYQGLHSYTGMKLQEFDLKKVNFYLNISYNFGFISFGAYGETFSIEFNPIERPGDNTIRFYYGLFIEYKIF